jgi:hypothetical protein
LLVEQADQEMALNGEISPFTQMQLQAHAEGKPIPRIDFGAIWHRVSAEREARQQVENDIWGDEEFDFGYSGNW